VNLKEYVRNVPDFPKKGIVFRDITTLLKEPAAIRFAADQLVSRYAGQHISKVVGVESRGFILGSILADRLSVGFVPIRKPGKLPSSVLKETYQLEYGSDAIEIHSDAISKGDRILLHDDLLATGGTAAAAISLITKMGGVIVEAAFLIELTFLQGRQRLLPTKSFSLVSYDAE
jgi:adenine phosphoribosyltransferase